MTNVTFFPYLENKNVSNVKLQSDEPETPNLCRSLDLKMDFDVKYNQMKY